MNDAKAIPVKLLISLAVPFLMVTLGGLIVYKTFAGFFFPDTSPGAVEVNGPAVIYYALTLVVALMFFVMRQGYKGYEFLTMGVISLVYSFSLQKLIPVSYRHLYLYFVPLIVFFGLMWPILKYFFLNPKIRATRLLIFSLLSALAFTVAFWLQFIMLGQVTDKVFLQSRFLSGLMLFIFMGFGLSIADFMIYKMEEKSRITSTDINTTQPIENRDVSNKTN